jgi:hypothetical protein
MPRISRQIGWSQEANLLWYIIKELEKINSSLGTPVPPPTTTTTSTTVPA